MGIGYFFLKFLRRFNNLSIHFRSFLLSQNLYLIRIKLLCLDFSKLLIIKQTRYQ